MSAPSEAPTANHDSLPPQDIEAEMAALGAMLHSPDAADEALGLLRPEHFYRPDHQAIYAAMRDQLDEDGTTDVVTLPYELERRGELARIGGAPYLHTLMSNCLVTANVGKHCEVIRKAAARRVAVQVGSGITAHASSSTSELDDVLERARTRLDDAAEMCSEQDGANTALGDLLPGALEHVDAVQTHGPQQGVPTGFTDLDAVIQGLHPSQFIVLGARPGVGKTVLAMDFARSAAIKNNTGTLFFSLEMGRTELVTRMLSAESRVRQDDMRRKGGMSDADWVRLSKRAGELQDAPLHIVDEPNMTVSDIRSQARQMTKQHNIGLIVVDYVQLIESTATNAESRQTEVSAISRRLKLLAKELQVPVVAAAQLNRGPEQRQDKKPQLADLRESGSLEQDSDMVILINRPDASELDNPRMGEADLILAKHRAGQTTTVTVAHQLHYSRFVDMAKEPEQARSGMSVEDRANGPAPSLS